jgi:hypothetical protein
MIGRKRLSEHGFLTLFAVIIISAVGLAVAISVVLLGIGTSRTSLATVQSKQALSMANYCAETAIIALNSNDKYTGGPNINDVNNDGTTNPNVYCSMVIENRGGSKRIISTTGISGTIKRKVQVKLSKAKPKVAMVCWLEVGDFYTNTSTFYTNDFKTCF